MREAHVRAIYLLNRDPSVFRPPLRELPKPDRGVRVRRTRGCLRRVAQLLTRKGPQPKPAIPAPER